MKDNRINRGRSQRTVRNIGAISLTDPGKALKPREAYERYRAGTLQENTLKFYYDAYDFPGEEVPPDYTTMTKIDQLKLLAEKRKQVQDYITQFGKIDESNNDNGGEGSAVSDPAPAT